MAKVTINIEQHLYVLPSGKGYSCLGFDVVLERSKRMAEWLPLAIDPVERGSIAAYEQYMMLLEQVAIQCRLVGERCPIELTSQLIGMEGQRVEVVDCWGEKRRFIVGKSTGIIPIHLEVARRDSSGGTGVTGAPFKSVSVVN